jgi:acetoin utilization deacetylase AcuC-like enzyme
VASADEDSRAPIAVVEDPRFLQHRAPRGHPERPERLAAVHEALALREEHLRPIEARPATTEEVLRVHTREHFEIVADAVRRAPGHIDADTYVSQESFDVALLAAGSAIDLARLVAAGEVKTGIAAIRPPGHHAEANRPMGFCLFNNVAITACALRAEAGVERILIFDWDVHHGNGTQHFFEEDPSVLYVSTHQYPYYPGTGDTVEAGIGAGVGSTLNIPLPAGCGDAEYVGALQRLLVPAALAFRPEIVLVSCGFDAHVDDPLASMEVTRAGFRDMATITRALADDLCDGRQVFLLEGGYAASGLREGTSAVLDALLQPQLPPANVEMPPGSTLSTVVGRCATVHAGHFPGIGSA